MFNKIINEFKLNRGDFDEKNKSGSFVVKGYEYVGKIWPKANDYRVVEYKLRSFNRYGMQAKINEEWIDVVVYENGYDDEGKVNPSKWCKLSDICSWSKNSMTLFKNSIIGIPEIPEPVE